MNSSPKAWPSLQICVAARSSCRGGSPDLPVNFVIPFATPLSNPRPCLSAPTLLEITEAHR